MQTAGHVLLVGCIQFADFASDLAVIVHLAMADWASADWIVCACAVGLSLCVTWVGLADGELTRREKLSGGALACGSLHLLYVGTLYIARVYEGNARKAEELYELFLQLKVLEAGIESIVLGLVTAGAIVRTLEGGSGLAAGGDLALLASSLVLSLLSMTYGFIGKAANAYSEEIGRRRPQLFLCLLVHLTWGLAAFGTLAAAAGPAPLLCGVGAMVALGSIRVFLETREEGDGCLATVGWTLLLTLVAGLPLVLVDGEFLGSASGSGEMHISQTLELAFVVSRRALLLGVAAAGVALAATPVSLGWAAVLAALFLLDLLCSPRALRLIGRIGWEPLGALLEMRSPANCRGGATTQRRTSSPASRANYGAASYSPANYISERSSANYSARVDESVPVAQLAIEVAHQIAEMNQADDPPSIPPGWGLMGRSSGAGLGLPGGSAAAEDAGDASVSSLVSWYAAGCPDAEAAVPVPPRRPPHRPSLCPSLD